MKLVVGMGSVDDYIDFVKAGADEIFVGYVPAKWQLAHGLQTPLNRREVCYYNVQIGSESEMEILAGLVSRYGIPVTIALNSLHYVPEQFGLIAEIIADCMRLGFHSFIVADYALIVYLYQMGIAERIDLHISGEFGEINHYMVRELRSLGMNRLIFHRKVTVSDMEQIVAMDQGALAYEAFLLNEKCHFHGGFCNSLHCDEMEPICRLPYHVDGSVPRGTRGRGCAFCKLWRMRELGITHLKIVGRGAYSKEMIEDIRLAKSALRLLEKAENETEFCSLVRKEDCNSMEDGARECYYERKERKIEIK